jgi:creatinine amidohydrolase
MHELESLTAPGLRRLLDRGVTTVIVPFGSIEQHGGHLPLGTDALLADIIGREVAVRLGALLAPTLRIGYAEQHMHLTGTLSLRLATLTDLAFDLGASMAKHGFTVIAFVSAHGGNAGPLDAAVERVNTAFVGAVACAPQGDVGPHPGSHSGEWLTSVMLALRPERVQLQAAAGDLAGELHAASSERGKIHLERFVAAIVDGVRTAAGSRGLRR